ncbi:MAG: hypothetical protein E7290_08205 [Lachnospiraceae bacterium]|nr:hypothetical protein [Lachnospiraceae bacterium]
MVRFKEETINANQFVGLTEECQLAINGGCTSKNEPTIMEDIAHAIWVADDYNKLGYHWELGCWYCQKYN